jgi:zinc transporter ZupT
LTSSGTFLESLLWGFVASVPLIAGSIISTCFDLKKGIIASIMALWAVVVLIGTISSAIGFSVLARADQHVISIALSYASGAILVMLAESMIPEAFDEGGSKTGLAAMAGFAIAFVLGQVGGG